LVAIKFISEVADLLEGSNDNVEVLQAHAQREVTALENQRDSLVSRLETAMAHNPANSEEFEARVGPVIDACKIATKEVTEPAEIAVDQIEYKQPIVRTIVMVIGDLYLVESLSPFIVLLSVLVRLYLNNIFRHGLNFGLSSLKC
jgi:hypothetical protein